MDDTVLRDPIDDAAGNAISDEQVAMVLKNVTPKHPVLRRLHRKLNRERGMRTEAAITSYDRMHHRHNRS